MNISSLKSKLPKKGLLGDFVDWTLEEALHKDFESFIKDHLLLDGFFGATDFLEGLFETIQLTGEEKLSKFFIKVTYTDKPFTIITHRLDNRYEPYSPGGYNLPLFLPRDSVISKGESKNLRRN